MIRRLRIKIICALMSIVILALGAILGVAIHLNQRNTEAHIMSMMRTLASGPMLSDREHRPSPNARQQFLVAYISQSGTLIATSGEISHSLDHQTLSELLRQVLFSRQESGKLADFGVRYLRTPSPSGYTVVLISTDQENRELQHMLIICSIIFVTTLAVFFGISLFLSHLVCKPVERAWIQQRQFVADASHELKTPLSVIMANGELLQNTPQLPPEPLKYSRNILTTSYQMRTLVENMLEMARVDNGSQKMQFTRVDFSQLVTDAVLSFQLLYQEQAMGLQSKLCPGIFLQGSEQHLYQVLDVLLDNALKYGQPRSTVCVSLTQTGKNCTLCVASQGQPLSAEELTDIFKRFYRTDKARTRNGSYGLGLPIAQSIVSRHSGKIWARSHQGWNSFFVQLPKL